MNRAKKTNKIKQPANMKDLKLFAKNKKVLV